MHIIKLRVLIGRLWSIIGIPGRLFDLSWLMMGNGPVAVRALSYIEELQHFSRTFELVRCQDRLLSNGARSCHKSCFGARYAFGSYKQEVSR